MQRVFASRISICGPRLYRCAVWPAGMPLSIARPGHQTVVPCIPAARTSTSKAAPSRSGSRDSAWSRRTRSSRLDYSGSDRLRLPSPRGSTGVCSLTGLLRLWFDQRDCWNLGLPEGTWDLLVLGTWGLLVPILGTRGLTSTYTWVPGP